MGPRAGLDGCGKSRPPPGFELHVSVTDYVTRCSSVAWAGELCWFAAESKLSSSLPYLFLGLNFSKRGCRIVPRYGLDDLGFGSRKGKGIFLSSETCRSSLGSTQHHALRVPGFFFGS